VLHVVVIRHNVVQLAKRAFVPERTTKAVAHPSPLMATIPLSKLRHVVVVVSSTCSIGLSQRLQRIYQMIVRCHFFFFVLFEPFKLSKRFRNRALADTLQPQYITERLQVDGHMAIFNFLWEPKLKAPKDLKMPL